MKESIAGEIEPSTDVSPVGRSNRSVPDRALDTSSMLRKQDLGTSSSY